MLHKLISKIVCLFLLSIFLFQNCSSRAYWRQVDSKFAEDTSVIKRKEYRLNQISSPHQSDPIALFALEERPIYGSKRITKERQHVEKKITPTGYLLSGTVLTGLGILLLNPRSQGENETDEEYESMKMLSLGLGIGFVITGPMALLMAAKGKTVTTRHATDKYRTRESQSTQEHEGLWHRSDVNDKVWLQSTFLQTASEHLIINGVLRVDYVADLGIGETNPIPGKSIRFRVYNDQLGINEEFKAYPSKFLQPYLEITKRIDNIRSGPGVNYNIVQKCFRGDLYPIQEERGNWMKVELRNRAAWAHNSIGRIVYAQPYRLDKAGPPNLVAEVGFFEPSGNGKLNAEETAKLTVKIRNRGKSPGYRLKVTPKSLTGLKSIDIEKEQTVGRINPGESKDVTFKIEAGLQVASSTERIRFDFTEYNGFQPQPLFVSIETKAFEPPDLQVVDFGIDDASGNSQIEQGEVAKITARVQNAGYGKAKQVQARIELGANVFLAEGSKKLFDLGSLDYNKHQDISFSIYTNNLITGKIPIVLSVTESRGNYGTRKNLGLVVNQRQRLASEFVFAGKKEARENLRDVTGLSIDIEKDIPETPYKNPEAVALIVGISDYQKAGIPKVRYARRDAYWVRKYVEKVLGFEPYRILPKNPEEVMTAGNLKTYVRQVLPALVRDGESDILVYYSGHGAPNVSEKSAYLVPYDCDPSFVNEDNAYRLDQFYSDLSRINSKSLTIVIDACFSGQARDGKMVIRQASPLFVKVDNPFLSSHNAVLFSSSALDQVSNWYPKMKHGMFTYFFLKGLRGDADSNYNRQITVGEMEAYLVDDRNGVPYWSQAEFLRKQVPQVLGDKNRVLINFR